MFTTHLSRLELKIKIITKYEEKHKTGKIL